MRLDRTRRGRAQHVNHLTREGLASPDVTRGAQAAALDDDGVLLVASHELVRRSEGTLQFACFFHHVCPVLRVGGELVIGTFAVVVVGEMTLDDARAECHRAEHRRWAMRMIGETQHHIWKHRRVSLEHIQMDVVVVLRAGGVVGVALHQHQLLVDGKNGVHCLLHLADGRSAGGKDDRLAFVRHVFERLDPVNLAGADFISEHERLKIINCLEIVRRGEVVNTNFITLLFQDRRPFEGDRRALIDLEDRFLPLGLVRNLPVHVRKAVIGNNLRGAEVLELGRLRPGLFCQADKQFRPRQVAVVVGGDVGDEVGGVGWADEAVANFDFH